MLHLRASFLGSFLIGISFVNAWVDLNISLITQLNLTQPLPILSLGQIASIPPALLNEFIANISPGANLTSNATMGGKAAYSGDQLIAFVDDVTGETTVFPNLTAIRPSANGNINITRAFDFIRINQSFPQDHTSFTVLSRGSLFGSTSGQNISTNPQLYLAHAVVNRTITSGGKSFPICGFGSTASFGFTADGNVRSLSYRWREATRNGQMMTPNTTDTIYQAITSFLEPFGNSTGLARVDKVDVCFYDSGLSFMQPVVRFATTLYANETTSAAAQARVINYLPIGSGAPEPIVLSISPVQGDPSFSPTDQNPPTQLAPQRRGPVPDIRVGRYVVRNDAKSSQDAWINNANNFLHLLQTPNGRGSSLYANFIDSQYYWAEPRLFTSQKNSFINSMHVVDVEVHGNWRELFTNGRCCDTVSINQIPSDGYGGGGGGSLAYWVIHSCEVIPTSTDYSAANFRMAYDDWFRIFNGIHAVVGYRTEMYIADNSIPPFSRDISFGGEFVYSWLSAVQTDKTYSNGDTYLDGNRNIVEPMGRASAVVVCGHESDRVWQVENLGRPNCLREFWYEN